MYTNSNIVITWPIFMVFMHGQFLRMCNNGIGRVPGNHLRVQKSACTNHSWNSTLKTNYVAISLVKWNKYISQREQFNPLKPSTKIDLVANFCLVSFKLSSATVSNTVRLHYLHSLINFTTLVFIWKMMMTTELWILSVKERAYFLVRE